MNSKGKAGQIILTILLIAAIAGVIAYWALNRSETTVIPTAQPAGETPQPTPKPSIIKIQKEIDVDTINEGVRDMGFLITQEYYFTEVVSFSSVKKLFNTLNLPLTESSYLASYEGTVTAGIDCTKITVEKDDGKGVIKVVMPKPEIKNIDIDPDSFELYSEKTGLGNPISASDFNSSLVELEDTARAKALDKGILEKADESARTIIGNFIGGMVDSTYTVEYGYLKEA